jgi:NTE family protein
LAGESREGGNLIREMIMPKKRMPVLAAIMVYSLLIAACATKPPVQPPVQKPAKIAVVLGAGAAKGFAHIGVLKVLESQKVPVHMIVGTSAGSFVGSLYAYGYNAYQLQNLAMTLDRNEVAELTIPDNGFLKGEKLRDYINGKLNYTPMEKLKIPFYAVATNIKSGEGVVFSTGNTGMAVQASCAVPGVFQPARFSGSSYVDGGVVNPVAVDVARNYGADVIIAVNITSGIDTGVPSGTLETIMKSIEIMYNKIAQVPLSKADVVIKPRVEFVGSADFSHRHEAILEGEKAAMAALPKINDLLAKLREEGRLSQ